MLNLFLFSLISCSTVERSPSAKVDCQTLAHSFFLDKDSSASTKSLHTRLNILNESNMPIDVDKLNTQFKTALDHFEKEIGPIDQNITVAIHPKGCLRTGYDPILNAVVFCKRNDVINAGLNSIDTFNHEFFHAFLCQIRPNACTDFKGIEHIHEALADYFAYQLNPDLVFGEIYYSNRDYIRKYNVSWKPGLVQGPHQKGNALVSQFIQEKITLKDALTYLEKNDLVDEVKDVVDGIPYSRINRYRLELNKEIKITFDFDPQYQNMKVVWKLPPEFEVTSVNETSAIIRITRPINSIEADAVFYSQDGVELGFRHYYFGLKK